MAKTITPTMLELASGSFIGRAAADPIEDLKQRLATSHGFGRVPPRTFVDDDEDQVVANVVLSRVVREVLSSFRPASEGRLPRIEESAAFALANAARLDLESARLKTGRNETDTGDRVSMLATLVGGASRLTSGGENWAQAAIAMCAKQIEFQALSARTMAVNAPLLRMLAIVVAARIVENAALPPDNRRPILDPFRVGEFVGTAKGIVGFRHGGPAHHADWVMNSLLVNPPDPHAVCIIAFGEGAGADPSEVDRLGQEIERLKDR